MSGTSEFRWRTPEPVIEYDEANEVPDEEEKAPATPGGIAAPATPGGLTLQRRRARTRQLQRGFWEEVQDDSLRDLLQATLQRWEFENVQTWCKLDVGSELGEAWRSRESAQAEVHLILISTTARKMRKPQPFAGPSEVPLRRSVLLLKDGKILQTSWEEWSRMSPASQTRPLVAKDRLLYVVLFGKELGATTVVREEQDDDRWAAREAERERKWQALPRELKLAVKRIHVNLGHATTATMLRSLRISKASTTALKAVQLFRCTDCPRMMDQPKEPRPSKVPLVHDFNVMIGLDVFEEKDASKQSWSWLNIFDQGTTFQVCALLPDSHGNPSGAVVLEALQSHWLSWAGYPERGVVTDRAKYFLSDVAEHFSDHGCTFSSAAKAAPWQIGAVERHGGLWKEVFRRVAWAEQVSGRDGVLMLTAAVTQAKNSLSRRHGFAPSQWVLGRDLRLPAALCDDSEVARVGRQALAETPGSRFHRQNQLRVAARESFVKAANDSALRRAELRKIRPTRGPFPVGTYVYYYDAADREAGPHNWRGIARVVGHEGSSTVWLAHRGILIAVSPEHLSRAYEEEIDRWMVVNNEQELIDATPAAGGTGFLDLRKAPLPVWEAEDTEPVNEHQEMPAVDDAQPDVPGEPSAAVERELRAVEDEVPQQMEPEDLSSSSTSMARMRLESDREQRRSIRSSDFFNRREEERRAKKARRMMPFEQQRMMAEDRQRTQVARPPEEIPAGPEYDVDLDDYRTKPARQLSPLVEVEDENQEREAKRLRLGETPDSALYSGEAFRCYMTLESKHFLASEARLYYEQFNEFYEARGVSMEDFLFAARRNSFDEKYRALADHAFANQHVQDQSRRRVERS